jgi:hypothetical protein
MLSQGHIFGEELQGWVHMLRREMDSAGWVSYIPPQDRIKYLDARPDGLLLAHVHRQWGLADHVQIDALAGGADGIWCSLAEEGGGNGHACSAVTLTNLARLGNKDVLERYNCQNFAHAARTIEFETTCKPCAPRQTIYGPRAIEAVFDFGAIAGGGLTNMDMDGDGDIDEVDRFDLSRFFGFDKAPARISALSR